MSIQASDAKKIFLEVVEKCAPEQWPEFLADACGDDQALRERVEALLKAHDQFNEMLDGEGLVPTIDQQIAERPGSQIGPYKLLQEIGHGGMGVVYMAEQSQPVQRRVALKIIKPGMDTRQVIARFEAERQALAMMDHPNIARVLDAGATESGRPYFVMELVNGIPVTEYCDEQHLSPKERLELFLPICQAVQHAHQKGIIHRDLKPSNILVALYDHEPVPKVIDFGVAKATSQSLTEKTLFTQFGQVVGTLEYMSPEQARRNQLDIDTRSDIYALGVLLYELLTGTTPFDKERLRSAGFDEVLRIIREEEPPRPSTRLSSIETLPSVAASRRTEPRKLRTLVRGELDLIVMKALDKDRARRYDTATNFAADIERFLNHKAVLACPPSTVYRCKKFARRNRATLVTASTILAALLMGLAGTAWQAALASQTERRTRAEGLVTSLLNSDVTNIPTAVSDLVDLRRWADQMLKDEIAKAGDGSAKKLHLSLALLPVDESQVDYLSRQLPFCTLDQFLVVRDALDRHSDRVTDFLWQFVQDEQHDDPQRFQAAAALATYDPKDERWDEIRDRVASHLVTVDLAFLGTWKDAFQGVAEVLVEPLSDTCYDPRQDDVTRSLAAALLAHYASEDVEALTKLVSYADEITFDDLYQALRPHATDAVNQLKSVLEELATDTESEKESLAERQANAAVALLRMGEHDTVWPLLKQSADPRLRTWIIHRVRSLGAAHEVIAERLETETDDSIRRALILALGEYETSPIDQGPLASKLLDWYEHDPDPGIHAACQWLLRRLNRQSDVTEITDRLATAEVSEDRNWYVSGQGHTMVKFPGPIEFSMGSPLTEQDRRSDETIHRKLIDRSFAISSTEVTVKQFRDFEREVPGVGHKYSRFFAPVDHCPQTHVTWYEAAAYCRWLSEKEGIPNDQMCYPEIPNIRADMMLPTNYLSRTGYRLPTEAEWEFGCRAGAATSRFYGQTEKLLGQYCWYFETANDRTRPVGSLKPNDAGLFDMYGNVAEWCQESSGSYRVAVAGMSSGDTEDRVPLSDDASRVYRGASFFRQARTLRSAHRAGAPAAFRHTTVGFRLARTYE